MTYTADQAIAEYFALDTADLAAVTAEIQAGRSIGDLIASAGLGASGFVVEAPSSSTTNVIQPTGAAVVPLTVKGFAAQSANLTEWQNSFGGVIAAVGPGGVILNNTLNLTADAATNFNIYHAPPSGFRTVWAIGNRDVAFLTGGTGKVIMESGVATAIPLVVKGFAAQSGNLQEWQNSAGTPLIKISSAGWVSAIVLQQLDSNGLYIGASGDKLGFLGASPIVKQTGVAVSIAAVHAALVALGLIGV